MPMRVALAPEYLPAYAQLPRRAQRGADEFLRKLAADPRQSSIRHEAIPGACDRHLRLAPLDGGHAVVIWAPDSGSVFLLWVGPTDEASRVAASKRISARAAKAATPLLTSHAKAHAGGATPSSRAAGKARARATPKKLAPSVRNGRRPSKTTPAGGAPDVKLDSLRLPARMQHFAERRGMTTLGELARMAPRALLAERGLGRTSIAETRAVIEQRLGRSWEELAGQPPEGAAPVLPRTGWDALRASLPEAVGALAIDDVEVPARVRSYAAREGLQTVSDLARRSQAELTAVPNFGRRSMQSIRALVATQIVPRAPPAGLDLLASWKKLVEELAPLQRVVMERRSGLTGPPQKLGTVAKALGKAARYVRQHERQALRKLWQNKTWLHDGRARAGAALGEGGAVLLEALAKDPWWADVAAQPETLDYFGRWLLAGAFRVVRLDERVYVARCTQETLDEAWRAVREVAAQLPFPRPVADVRARAMRCAGPVGDALASTLWERLRGSLLVDEGGRHPRVLGLRGPREASLITILRASRRPLRLADLEARVGAMSALPEEILRLGPDVVGVERHFPGFARWMDRLVPLAIGVMGRQARGRLWPVSELFDAVREGAGDLPNWLDEWHFGSLLRRSGRVRWMGYRRVALPGGPKRGSVRDEMLRIVRNHGEPIPESELRRALARRVSCRDALFTYHLARAPFLRCETERVGLVDRDLPGGLRARELAATRIAAVLERSGTGLSPVQIREQIAPLSKQHARWSQALCRSILHGDPRFRFSTAGGVGLSSWERTRLPSLGGLIRQCLDEGGGRAAVEVVAQRIAAQYGETRGGENIGVLANTVGAVKRGAWLEWAPRTTPDRRR